ncbi:MAG: histidine phosphatase family protein [Oscillospiraceae bacterium]
MIIHLIRHGETEATENKLYYGATDLPISEGGRERLNVLRLAGGYPEIRKGLHVYTSGMRRTDETLSLLYGDVPHDVLPGLREMDFGAFEMHSYEELKQVPAYIEWISGDNLSNRCPGGESGAELKTRVIAVIAELLKIGEDCLIITHGGVIDCVMEHFFPEENKNRYDWQPKPGEGFSLTIDREGGKVGRRAIPDLKPFWLGKGYSFFQNKACEYFPCHATKRPENFNCIFCYCPLYALGENCGGNFRYTENGDKDCSGCLVPHMRENYGKIIEKYPLIRELAAKKKL